MSVNFLMTIISMTDSVYSKEKPKGIRLSSLKEKSKGIRLSSLKETLFFDEDEDLLGSEIMKKCVKNYYDSVSLLLDELANRTAVLLIDTSIHMLMNKGFYSGIFGTRNEIRKEWVFSLSYMKRSEKILFSLFKISDAYSLNKNYRSRMKLVCR